MSKWFSLFVFVLSIIVPIFRSQVISAETPGKVIINEFKLGGTIDGQPTEYVELFNSSDQAVDVTGWLLEYAKPAAVLTEQDCSSSSSWQTIAGSTNVKQAVLSGAIPSSGTAVVTMPMNDNAGGSLRLFQSSTEPVIHDIAGWGSDVSKGPCSEGAHIDIPSNLKSAERLLGCSTDLPTDLDDNAADFASGQTPTPSVLGAVHKVGCKNPAASASCDGVEISEILPNPKGADAGGEFIEIHNPTDDSIDLDDCSLSVADNSNKYTFQPGMSLGADQYLAFYDDTTGLVLPNAAGGEVMLSSDTTDYAFQYPGDMNDDISWALVGSEWQATDRVTPSAPNQPMTPEERVGKGAGGEELEPCPSGKFRNPLTNRCKSIVLATAALTPCKPGQERNPDTNRCRSTVLAGSTLTPCKPGQERNPETNRCRSVLASSSTLKPCGADEERNPETNRCRKAATKLAAADNNDKQSESNKVINYGILGFVGASALSYGAYEYRNDFRNKFAILKSRFFPGKSGE